MDPNAQPKNQTGASMYKVRTMANDLAAAKKGAPPSNIPVVVELPKQPLPSQEQPPVLPRLPQPSTFSPPRPFSPPAAREEIKIPIPQATEPFSKPIGQPIQPPKVPVFPSGPPAPRPFIFQAPPLPPLEPKKLEPLQPTPPFFTPAPIPPKTPPPPKQPFSSLLPPLPSTPLPPAEEIIKPPKRSLLTLGILAVFIITFIVGEIWWFFLRPKPTPPPISTELLPPPESSPLPEIAPVPVSPEPTLTQPPTEEQPIPSLPAGLANYDQTQVIEITSLAAKDVVSAIAEVASQTFEPEELVQLVIRSNTLGENLANLENIVQSLGLKVPAAVNKEFLEEFNLFALGGTAFDKNTCDTALNKTPSCYGPRLGLVVKIINKVRLNTALRSWEKTMVNDLKPIILSKVGRAATVGFQSASYRGQIIRYQNLPLSTITIEYALVNDLLVIATSKSSMLSAIDAVLEK